MFFLGVCGKIPKYTGYTIKTHISCKLYDQVKLDEREVSGIYDTPTSKDKAITQVIVDEDSTINRKHVKRPTQDEPMECPDELFSDNEMQDVDDHDQDPSRLELTEYRRMNSNMVFRPQLARSRRSQKPVLMLENGLESDDDEENDDHFYPPPPEAITA